MKNIKTGRSLYNTCIVSFNKLKENTVKAWKRIFKSIGKQLDMYRDTF